MASTNFPDQANLADTIAECMDVVHVSNERRAAVIQNSLFPISMLMEASRLAHTAGPEEASVFEYFVHYLNAQLETKAKERGFASLVSKLAQFKKLH